MAHGMTEIEDLSVVGLQRISHHHLCLDENRLGHEPSPEIQVLSGQRGIERLDSFQQIDICNDRMLDHLGKTVEPLVGLQRGETGQVYDHGQRRVKRPNEILARRRVHPGLAPHRGVHHGKERGGQVHRADAPHVGSSGEARKVAGHAAAECHHQGTSVQAGLEHGVFDALFGGPGLGGLTCRKFDAGHRLTDS